MKRHLSIFPIILIVIFSACKEHLKPEIKATTAEAVETSQPFEQFEVKSLDHDPYFEGTSDQSSSVGPTTITRNVLQDNKGNIWLATWDGIMRYDGQSKIEQQDSFINFTNKEGLRRFRVFTILEDQTGDIWFGTIGAGIYRYDGNSFTNFTTLDGLVNDEITHIYEDSKGLLWFCTTGGLSCYDGKAFKNFTKADGLTDNDVNSIVEDQSGKFWIGTRGSACTFDGASFTKLINDEGMSFQNVRRIIEDSAGNIWLGGNDGLWQYNTSPLLRPTKFINFTKDFVGYIYEDSKGDIWTTSATGGNSGVWKISRYDESSISSGSLMSTEVLTQENMFFGIVEDMKGGMWFGSLRGVCRYDGSGFEYFK